MAAATINTRVQINIDGSLRQRVYPSLSIANTGDTLQTNLKTVFSVESSDGAITKMTSSGGLITFTSGGAVAGFSLNVIGR